MKLIPTFSLSCVLLFSAFGGENRPSPWSSVVFSVPHEDGKADVKIEGLESLSSVKVNWGGKALSVPEEELEGIDDPMLHSAQLLFGADFYGAFVEGEKPTPHVLVEMDFGERSEFGGFSNVRFLFHSGKYQERIVSTEVSPNTWKEVRKILGGEEEEMGTTTRLPRP